MYGIIVTIIRDQRLFRPNRSETVGTQRSKRVDRSSEFHIHLRFRVRLMYRIKSPTAIVVRKASPTLRPATRPTVVPVPRLVHFY